VILQPTSSIKTRSIRWSLQKRETCWTSQPLLFVTKEIFWIRFKIVHITNRITKMKKVIAVKRSSIFWFKHPNSLFFLINQVTLTVVLNLVKRLTIFTFPLVMSRIQMGFRISLSSTQQTAPTIYRIFSRAIPSKLACLIWLTRFFRIQS
jgi:hypothetical protein